MAKRPNLAAVDLTPTKRIGRPPKLPGSPEPDRGGKKAGTVRLPPEDWRRLRVQAALLDTSQLELVHRALHEWFERNPLPPGVKL
jgi:hypothetical protein